MQNSIICCACIEQGEKLKAKQNGFTIIDGTNQNTMNISTGKTELTLDNKVLRRNGREVDDKEATQKRARQKAMDEAKTKQVQQSKEDTSR